MIFSKLPSFFKTPPHRRFQYRPRFHNPSPEREEKSAPKGFKQRWGYTRRMAAAKSSRIRLAVLAALVLLLLYLLLGI